MTPPPATLEDLGLQLRQARLAKGWSLAEVRHRTKIGLEQLHELETGHFGPTTDATLLRYRLRAYARELDLEDAEWLSLFDQALGASGKVSPPPPAEPQAQARNHGQRKFPKLGPWPIALAGGGLVLVLITTIGLILAAVLKGIQPPPTVVELVVLPPTPAARPESQDPPPSVTDSYPLIEMKSVDVDSLLPPTLARPPASGNEVPAGTVRPDGTNAPFSIDQPTSWLTALQKRANAFRQETTRIRQGWKAGGDRVLSFMVRNQKGTPPAIVSTPEPPPEAVPEPVGVPARRPIPETLMTSQDPATVRLRAAYQGALDEEVRWESAWNQLAPMEGDAEALLTHPDIAKHSVVSAIQTRLGQQEVLLRQLVEKYGEDHPAAVRVRQRMEKQGNILRQVALQFPGLLRQRYQQAADKRQAAEAALVAGTLQSD
jgi:cytoskeletal protein RodZ